MSDQSGEANQSPTPEEVLSDLLRTVQGSLQFAESVIRGEEFARGGTAVGMAVAPLGERLETARHIVEVAGPLAEKLNTLRMAGKAQGF